MTEVVASTPHASNGAQSLPYIPASSPSLWAELPSLPCSVEALSQKNKHTQQHHIDLARLFDDAEPVDGQEKVVNGAEEFTLNPSSRAGERSATTSVDSEVRGPAPMRDPFELFDVGSPWTQVNISTQWQRRLWLGKAVAGDPSSDDAIDTAYDEPREHRERRHRQRDEPVHKPRQAKKRRQSRTSATVNENEEQDVVREMPMRKKKTRLAVELSDEDSDEEQSNQAGPSMLRRAPSPLRSESLPQAKVSPLQRTSAPVQQVISPPRDAAAQTPRPRPKPRVSSVRAPASAAQTPHPLPPGTADSEDDAPSATQFFTRKKRRRTSAEFESDQVEEREAGQRARTPMPIDASPASEGPGLADAANEDHSATTGEPAVTDPEVHPLLRARARSQASQSTTLSADARITDAFPKRALNDRTVSFGQLSKDDEDALESFVEGMDSEDDDDDAEGLSGGQALESRGAAAVPVARGEASAGGLRPPSPSRSRSRTPLGLRAAEAWLCASPSPPPLIEDYDDDDDPSVPSGLAPLLPDLDEEKRRGYFAQFDSLLGLGRSAAGSRSVPQGGTSGTALAWADERAREEDEGVGIEWPTTPSARFGGSASAVGRALGRAESDSRLLPNRFTGFSRPILSCSQLLAADADADGDETAVDSPSTRRDRPAGTSNDSRNSASITITGTGDRAHLIARSRNAAGMGLVRKTWGTTWREDGTRLVRGRVVRRASPPLGPAVLGAVDPRREREMWADDVGVGQTGQGQRQGKQAAKRSGSGSGSSRPTKTKRRSGASSSSSSK